MDEEIELFCECDSLCSMKFKIPLSRAEQHIANVREVFIADGCLHGPETTDVLVSVEQGYKVYRSAE